MLQGWKGYGRFISNKTVFAIDNAKKKHNNVRHLEEVFPRIRKRRAKNNARRWTMGINSTYLPPQHYGKPNGVEYIYIAEGKVYYQL